MKKLIKWAVIISVLALCLLLLSPGIIYWKTINGISPFNEPSDKQYPELLYQVEWVAHGEVGDIDVKMMNPWQFVTDAFLAFNEGGQLKNRGSVVASQAARVAIRDSLYEQRGRRHWHMDFAVASIWVSRQWSTQEILATVLDGNYYGYQIDSVEQAAGYYFAKELSALTIDEVLSLAVIARSPGYYHPFCDADRFQVRAEYVAKLLSDNWPEYYLNYTYTKPSFRLSGCDEGL